MKPFVTAPRASGARWFFFVTSAAALAGVALSACSHGGESEESHAATTSAVWLRAPAVDASLAVPKEAHRVVAHAAASGTQNYSCAAAKEGTGYAWTLTGPEAALSGSGGSPMGKHFASPAGAAAPEWQTPDGTYIVAHKLAAFTPSGTTGAVPWLLLQVDGKGGAGSLAGAQYVQRVNTHGGVAPAAGCDQAHAGATQKVPYNADYFFFGS
jgi:hypothetical protein